MQPFPVEPAETTYAITVDANNEAAERWFAQADETTLTQTLAGARDLARDIGLPLVLRDAEGFLRGHVDADGGYRMVDCETHDLSATRSLIPSVLRGFARSANILGTEWGFGDMVTAWTSCPPSSAADHLLRQINSEWSETRRRALAARAEMERLQQKCARARTPTTRERASAACRSASDEYSRLCAECDALEAHAEKVRPFSKPAEE